MKLGEQTAIRIENYEALDTTKICYFQLRNHEDEEMDWYLYLPRCGLAGLKNHTVT